MRLSGTKALHLTTPDMHHPTKIIMIIADSITVTS